MGDRAGRDCASDVRGNAGGFRGGGNCRGAARAHPGGSPAQKFAAAGLVRIKLLMFAVINIDAGLDAVGEATTPDFGTFKRGERVASVPLEAPNAENPIGDCSPARPGVC